MRTTFVFSLLFVAGAAVGGLAGLYIALPPQAVECGDACGTRALVFALRSGLIVGFLLAAIGTATMAKRRGGHASRPKSARNDSENR